MKQIILGLFGVIALCWLATKFVSKQTVNSISVAEETLAAARDESFDYLGHLRNAQMNGRDSLRELLIFSEKTDAAGSIGHRLVIKELEKQIGRNEIITAIQNLNKEQQAKLEWFIRGEPAF